MKNSGLQLQQWTEWQNIRDDRKAGEKKYCNGEEVGKKYCKEVRKRP